MLTIILFALFTGQAVQATDQAATVADLVQKLARAWVDRDRAFIEALLAPDWSVTDSSGAVLTKQQVLDQTFASIDRSIDAMTIDQVQVRMFGDTAVVTGRTRASGKYQGNSVTATLRFTDVFVLRAGRWVIVASHGSSVAP